MRQLEGTVNAFFLFDVGEAIDLDLVRARVGATTQSRLALKPVTPPYVQYSEPPVVLDGSAVGTAAVHNFRVRFKAFDYGVISVALIRPLPATWEELMQECLRWYEDPALGKAAEELCRSLVSQLGNAVRSPRPEYLSEDYWVFAATRVEGVGTSEAFLNVYGTSLAQLLRGERDPLSPQERDEVLRHRLSYFASDLVVPTWNGAFVFDNETGTQAALEIFEFANSQLLEFRYYDQLLDGELARIYSRLQRSDWRHAWLGRRYARAARQVHALFIDVNELTDKTENALKITGDVYASRLFALAAARLGLDQWKANVREKLKTLDDIYRFAVEQTAMTRGEFLEATIVAILVLELILFFLGIMR